VVDIEGSTDVTLQGCTINGCFIAVFCSDFSICRFKRNTIQNNLVGLTSLESSSVRSNGGLVVRQNRSERFCLQAICHFCQLRARFTSA